MYTWPVTDRVISVCVYMQCLNSFIHGQVRRFGRLFFFFLGSRLSCSWPCYGIFCQTKCRLSRPYDMRACVRVCVCSVCSVVLSGVQSVRQPISQNVVFGRTASSIHPSTTQRLLIAKGHTCQCNAV